MENATAINSRLLSPVQLAGYIGKSLQFVYKHVQTGRLPGLVRVGRHLMYDRNIIDMRIASGVLLYDGERPENKNNETRGA